MMVYENITSVDDIEYIAHKHSVHSFDYSLFETILEKNETIRIYIEIDDEGDNLITWQPQKEILHTEYKVMNLAEIKLEQILEIL